MTLPRRKNNFQNILNILRKIIIFNIYNIAVYGSGLSAKSHNLRNAGSNPAAATEGYVNNMINLAMIYGISKANYSSSIPLTFFEFQLL